MALFKILKGASARIDTTTTPLHEGYAYFTDDDGNLHIDTSTERIQVGTEVLFSATQPTPSGKTAIWFHTEPSASNNNSNNNNGD